MQTPNRIMTAISGRSVSIYLVVIVLLWLGIGWTSLGGAFYHRVLPFYDSLSYQHEYHRELASASRAGAATGFANAWGQPSNTALYLLFAGLFHPVLADNVESFYLFFCAIHLAGVWILVRLLIQDDTKRYLACLAAASWLFAVPFSQTYSGVIDQRMDLSTASLFLVLMAFALEWSRRPSRGLSVALGLSAAILLLHRPVMCVAIAGSIAVFVGLAFVRQERQLVWRSSIYFLGPIALIALPWLIYHRDYLQLYYLKGGYNVGNASLWEAARFNVAQLGRSVGVIYAGLVLVPLTWFAVRREIDWPELGAILFAGAVPVLVLIASRSAGNYGACLIPLGIPALTFASVRPGRTSVNFAWANLVGMVGVLFAAGWSLSQLRAEVESVSPAPRLQAARAVLQLDEIPIDGPRILSGFNAWPLDVIGLTEIAREQGIEFTAGIAAFHPYHFGIDNAKGASVSEAEAREGIARVLEKIAQARGLLILPSAESEKLLPAFPFSHGKIGLIRQEVARDARFVLVKQVGPIAGCILEVYKVRAH